MRPFFSLLLLVAVMVGCPKGTSRPQHRERAAARDKGCTNPAKPHAYFYAAENRTNYAPDDPFKDGCVMFVPDHLFCCPGNVPGTAGPDAG